MLSPKPKIKREKSAAEALSSLMRLCARAERSSGNARRLMATWGVKESEREGVLQRLISDRFIDDGRYAEAFIREKSNLSAWGEYKIRTALRRKGIAEAIINEALKQLPKEKSEERLREKLIRKMRTTKHSSAYELRTKLIRYALSLGYTMEQAISQVEQVTANIKSNEECEEFFF